MSPFTASSWVTAWTLSPFGVILAVLLIGGYAALLVSSHRRGLRWPAWKTLAYLVFGVFPLVYVTCGAVGVYRTTFFWMFGAQIAVLSAVTPTGLALGDPVGLWTQVAGSDTWIHRALHSRVARVLMFPMLGSLLSVASIILIFFTGYAQTATRNDLVGVLADLQVLIIGTLVVLPLITEDLLPAWAGPGVRTFLSIVDGLLDAIPGILVMTSFSILAPRFPGFAASAEPLRGGMSHLLDQKYTGGALLAIAEVIGIPLMGAVFVDWMRSDDAQAREADALLDARAASVEGPEQDAAGTATDEPWWLSDPRMADRFHRPGDD